MSFFGWSKKRGKNLKTAFRTKRIVITYIQKFFCTISLARSISFTSRMASQTVLFIVSLVRKQDSIHLKIFQNLASMKLNQPVYGDKKISNWTKHQSDEATKQFKISKWKKTRISKFLTRKIPKVGRAITRSSSERGI